MTAQDNPARSQLDFGENNRRESLFQPIPLEVPSVAGWKQLEIRENQDLMVALGAFSDYSDIFTSSIYYGEHTNSPYGKAESRLEGSLLTMFVRAEVATQLRRAQDLLPERHYLIVLDSYRSIEVQQALYDHYLATLREAHPDWQEDALSNETQKYVSTPSREAACPSPHNTGGAVDLAIYCLPEDIDERLKSIDHRLHFLALHVPKQYRPIEEATDPFLREQYMLEMTKLALIRQWAEFLNFGTPFDHGGPEAALNHFEVLQHDRALTPDEIEARDNRRMLYNIMRLVDMQPYADEWWHFNSAKSQMGAQVAGLAVAEFGAAVLDERNVQHEKIRQMHRAGLIKVFEGNPSAKQLVDDPRHTELPGASIIAAPRD